MNKWDSEGYIKFGKAIGGDITEDEMKAEYEIGDPTWVAEWERQVANLEDFSEEWARQGEEKTEYRYAEANNIVQATGVFIPQDVFDRILDYVRKANADYNPVTTNYFVNRAEIELLALQENEDED